MFNEEIIKLINDSWVLKKWCIKIMLFVIFSFLTIYITILILWTFIPNINIDYIKVRSISTILATIFWGSFIMLIIWMATKWEELNEKKKELLDSIKKIIEKNKLTKYFDNFSSTRSSLWYKTISSSDKLWKNIRINITLLKNDDDFWRFSLYINNKDYDKLDKTIKNKFKKEEWNEWNDYSYPYIEKFDGSYKTLEKQLLEIVKILKK
jgi:hypothetical protein